MRPMSAAISIVAAGLVLGLCFPADAAAEGPRKPRSFKAGYFYASVSKDDGVMQLSECAEIKEVGRFAGNKRFLCVRDGKGFRCTANETLDVIFLFNDKKTCEADQKQTLNSEEN